MDQNQDRFSVEQRALIAKQISEISEEQIFNHIRSLEGVKHPVATPQALRAGADYISDQMKTFGLDPVEEEIEGAVNHRFTNVIGRLAGSRAGQKILVIGAHYDTIPDSPGADDNASGLAVLLEVARVLSPLRGKLTLQFVAFSLEEEGFLGSDHYVRQVRRNKIPLWGAIVLECVGYTSRKPKSQKTPPGLPIPLPDKGDFIGLVGNAAAEPIQKAYESAASAYCADLPYVSYLVPGKGEGLPDSRRSDHVPFWDRGYRALMLTDTANFRNPNYHQKGDRLETLDIPFITQVARALAAAVIDLADLKVLPPAVKLKPPQEIYIGKVVRLFVEQVLLPNNKTIELEVIRHPGASAVVPLREDGTVVMIRQFRHAAGGYIYEIPAGKLSEGETPEACASREVEEEIGYRVGNLKKLTTIFTAPGFCDEQIHLFLGTGLVEQKQQLDEDEVLEVIMMPFEEAIQKIEDQTIRDAKSIVGLQMAYAYAKKAGLI